MCQVLRPTFLESDRFFCFISIHKFGSFKNSFAMIIDCLNFTLVSEDLFSWVMDVAWEAKKHGDEWGLTWYLWWGINTSIHQFQLEPTHKIKLSAAEWPSLKISSHGTSLKWSRRPSQSAQE